MTETNDKAQENIAYLGALNMLRQLVDQGKITEEERAGAAARIAQILGAELIMISI